MAVIEKTFIKMIGFSYRPACKNTMRAMQSRGECIRPYLQFYIWFWVVTFRPPWRHVNKVDFGSYVERYCLLFDGLSKKITFEWGDA